jgi:hypothetical protein
MTTNWIIHQVYENISDLLKGGPEECRLYGRMSWYDGNEGSGWGGEDGRVVM